MKQKNKGNNIIWGRAGFTLIELLVTITILGVALGPMISAYVAAWEAGIGADRQSVAVMLANWKIDQIRTELGFENVTNGSGNFSDPGEMGQDMYEKFDYEVEVTSISGNLPAFEAKEVRLTVEFPDPISGNLRTVRCSEAVECDFDFIFVLTNHEPLISN